MLLFNELILLSSKSSPNRESPWFNICYKIAQLSHKPYHRLTFKLWIMHQSDRFYHLNTRVVSHSDPHFTPISRLSFFWILPVIFYPILFVEPQTANVIVDTGAMDLREVSNPLPLGLLQCGSSVRSLPTMTSLGPITGNATSKTWGWCATLRWHWLLKSTDKEEHFKFRTGIPDSWIKMIVRFSNGPSQKWDVLNLLDAIFGHLNQNSVTRPSTPFRTLSIVCLSVLLPACPPDVRGRQLGQY